jgi:hypothetical protein
MLGSASAPNAMGSLSDASPGSHAQAATHPTPPGASQMGTEIIHANHRPLLDIP